MIVLNIINSKGGVGKTTTATAFATLTAKLGLTTLFVDMAPQANGTLIFTDNIDEYDISAFLENNGNIEEEDIPYYTKRIRENGDYEDIYDNLYVITSSQKLNKIKDSLPEDGLNLRRSLKCLEDYFDVVIIDNDPILDNKIAKNSLLADPEIKVIIPVKMDLFSFQGSKDLLEYVRGIREKENPSLEIKGFLPTIFNNNMNDKAVYEQFQIYYNKQFVLNTQIRDRAAASKAVSFCLPIPIYDPNDDCTLDYMKALLELDILPEECQKQLRTDTLNLHQKLTAKKERRKSRKSGK